MKAAYINQPGPAESIIYGDLPEPSPSETEVLVKVGAVAVNPIDTYIRSGAVSIPIPFPYIIGCDLAGTVEACGSQVTRFRPGDRVWGSNQSLFGRHGTFAEYAAVDERGFMLTPEKETNEEAAAGALVGDTAHLGLFLHAGLQVRGDPLFVNGGTGGVGSTVVQLAKASGAKVVTTVGTADKKAAAEGWGCDLVVNYHDADADEQIAAFAKENGGIDVWFETLREPTSTARSR